MILGTLGRQGNPSIFRRLKTLLKSKGKVVVPFLMAEINPVKLAMITEIDAWVQVACPRLSIDWYVIRYIGRLLFVYFYSYNIITLSTYLSVYMYSISKHNII